MGWIKERILSEYMKHGNRLDWAGLAELKILSQLKEDDFTFIKHIEKHLTGDQVVICKICGKSAKEIISDAKCVEDES